MATQDNNNEAMLEAYRKNHEKQYGSDGNNWAKIVVAVSQWNSQITEALYQGALTTLQEFNYNVERVDVPGTFEIPLAIQTVCEKLMEEKEIAGFIAIGSVIRGETPHFDYVCQGVTYGIQKVMLKYNKPVSFCVLTTENIEQARDRTGGKYGNKGVEAAIACMQMIDLENKYKLR